MRHVIRALEEKSQGKIKIIVVCDCDPRFFSSLNLKHTVLYRASHDVGLIQSDSFTVDTEGTLRKLGQIRKQNKCLFTSLLTSLKGTDLLGVASDTSSFGFLLAHRLQVPGHFIGNFTWSDIYRDLAETEPRFMDFVPEIEEQYSLAHQCLMLPLHTPMQPFNNNKVPVPLIGPDISKMSRQTFDQITGKKSRHYKKTVLLSFGGFDFNSLPLEAIASMPEFLFITTRAPGKNPPPNLVQINTAQEDYGGIIKNSDLIITKPGYGIITDCLAHKKPLIYTDRGRFLEYNVLKSWLDDYYPSVFMPQNHLREGKWESYIKKGLTLPPLFPKERLHGAKVIAQELLQKS